MNRTFEARLAKVEAAIVPRQKSHEDWLDILDSRPSLTVGERAVRDAEEDAQTIAQFGSFAAAAQAARQKADLTQDPADDLIVWAMEARAEAATQGAPR